MMKFLCLHGMGTTSQIFKTQTAAFRYELADDHVYEFVQGVVPWELPIELETLSNRSDKHFAYYDMHSSTSFITALDNLEAYVEAEGPFDSVLAYSQGAGLAAMLLIRRHLLQPQLRSMFRCAILFSPVQVYDPVAYVEKGEITVLDSLREGMTPVQLPIAIIYGDKDEKNTESAMVQRLCDPRHVSVFVHEGGHEVPGHGSKNGLSGAVKVARRCIIQAELLTES